MESKLTDQKVNQEIDALRSFFLYLLDNIWIT